MLVEQVGEGSTRLNGVGLSPRSDDLGMVSPADREHVLVPACREVAEGDDLASLVSVWLSLDRPSQPTGIDDEPPICSHSSDRTLRVKKLAERLWCAS